MERFLTYTVSFRCYVFLFTGGIYFPFSHEPNVTNIFLSFPFFSFYIQVSQQAKLPLANPILHTHIFLNGKYIPLFI